MAAMRSWSARVERVPVYLDQKLRQMKGCQGLCLSLLLAIGWQRLLCHQAGPWTWETSVNKQVDTTLRHTQNASFANRDWGPLTEASRSVRPWVHGRSVGPLPGLPWLPGCRRHGASDLVRGWVTAWSKSEVSKGSP